MFKKAFGLFLLLFSTFAYCCVSEYLRKADVEYLHSLGLPIDPSAYVAINDFGADPTGRSDSYSAFVEAFRTRKVVVICPGDFYLGNSVILTGVARVVGFERQSKIISDGVVFHVKNGPNTVMSEFDMVSLTNPVVVVRSQDFSGSVDIFRGDGYQPTVNDKDVSSEMVSFDIGPKIILEGLSNYSIVSRITGLFVSIIVKNSSFVSVGDCDFHAGKNFAGGVVFWNLEGDPGRGNVARNNKIYYPSYSGIVVAGQVGGGIYNNYIYGAGESGIKTYQGFVSGFDARNRNIVLANNTVVRSYYDGFDVSSDYPHKGEYSANHYLFGNYSIMNRRVGYFGDGRGFYLYSNYAVLNGLSGFYMNAGDSFFSNNFSFFNNSSNAEFGEHQFSIVGDGNYTEGNVGRSFGAGSVFYPPKSFGIDFGNREYVE